jgi:ribosomal protein L11 methyltransferase
LENQSNNRWEELWLSVPTNLSEDIGALLYVHGALSIEIRTASFPKIDLPEIQHLVGPPPPSPGHDWLIAAFAPDTPHTDMQQAASEALEDFGLALKDFESNILSREDDAWQERWKQYFKPIELERLRVLPVWEEPNAGSDKMTIRIDPGMAFGTGQHTTTVLCLEELTQLFDAEQKTSQHLLDFGCGSGILSIAAAMYGVTDIDGVDNDAPSIENAQKNVLLNDVAASINLYCPTIPEPDKRYDLIVANILAPILINHAEELCGHLEKQSTLLLSGVLNEQCAEVEEAYRSAFTAHGLELHEKPQVRQQNEWSLLRFALRGI